jgi:predicted DNA-binding ribbon-helix-helix protein
MEAMQRMVPLEGGKRAGIKLDGPTWQAIEWLAARDNKTWQQWCAAVITTTPSSQNTTAAIREAAMDDLLSSAIFEGRGAQLEVMAEHPLMKDSAVLSDQQLAKILSGATVQGWNDFGGFSIGFGHDEYGQSCIWVKNGLRDHQHFAFLVPSLEGGST